MVAMTRLFCILSAFGLVVGGGKVDAQPAPGMMGSGAGPRVPVTIVLSDDLPAAADYVIVRTPGRANPDVILLRTSTTEATFSAAVRALLLVRRREGDVPSARGVLRTARPVDLPPGNGAVLPWAARVLDDLHAAEPVPIEGIGTVKAATIWLPRQRAANPPR